MATADHSTGGMTIAKGKDYKWNPEAIHKMKHSGMYMTKEIAAGKDLKKSSTKVTALTSLANKWIK